MTVFQTQSHEDMLAEIAKLREQNERLRRNSQRRLSLKVSEKGAVQLNGLRRFPATYYKDEWLRILDVAEEIRAFIEDNVDSLSVKGDREG